MGEHDTLLQRIIKFNILEVISITLPASFLPYNKYSLWNLTLNFFSKVPYRPFCISPFLVLLQSLIDNYKLCSKAFLFFSSHSQKHTASGLFGHIWGTLLILPSNHPTLIKTKVMPKQRWCQKSFFKKGKNLHKKTHQIPPLPAGILQARALEKISNKTNMERMQLKTTEVFISPEALKTKLLIFTVNSLKLSRVSFQIKKRRNKQKMLWICQ